jgi:hypothetical protein
MTLLAAHGYELGKLIEMQSGGRLHDDVLIRKRF